MTRKLPLPRILIAAVLIGSGSPAQALPAGFFRVWQGQRRADLAPTAFIDALPSFMSETTRLYDGVLSDYLVAVPPAVRPAAVPDEFALVALASEADYRRRRATPAGERYSARHWDLFEKERSKSAPYSVGIDALPASLASGEAYVVLGQGADWREGHAAFFIGARRSSVSREDFRTRLAQHLRLVVDEFGGRGLEGYVVIAHDDYEAAFLKWRDHATYAALLAGPGGERVRADAAAIMDTVMWTDVERHRGEAPVEAGKFYSTLGR